MAWEAYNREGVISAPSFPFGGNLLSDTLTGGTLIATTASAEEISAIHDRIEQAIGDEPTGLVIIALLSAAILLQHPSIEPDDLISLVRETSYFLCMKIEGPTDPTELN